MPIVHIDATDEKFPAYSISRESIVREYSTTDPALLSDEELAFISDARLREAYADALISHRLDPDNETRLLLDRLAKALRSAGIAVPAMPTVEEFEAYGREAH